jgi:hypothetical protein
MSGNQLPNGVVLFQANQATWEQIPGGLVSNLPAASNPEGGFACPSTTRIGNKGVIGFQGFTGRRALDLMSVEIEATQTVGTEPIFPTIAVDCNGNGVWDTGVDALLGPDGSAPLVLQTKVYGMVKTTVVYGGSELIFKATASNACGIGILYRDQMPQIALNSLPANAILVDGVQDCSNPVGAAVPSLTVNHGIPSSQQASRGVFSVVRYRWKNGEVSEFRF